ncbi:glycoside hydrolase family 9 protein [Paenibacillus sp. MER 99-2]|uniref:glycoside hydrolase family 9 protein n=1 Tax=Paenibacillus sp. MER 99-2 TaxID=2939572 RepID=UPI00203D2E6F|nr:glycoside hydrolase family 9 protein [Paenibacillus sp. MER 99-2]MCM3174393.1 glycoside hydrolase family 9 protein [Paenibacillus sp. MER 99-2]
MKRSWWRRIAIIALSAGLLAGSLPVGTGLIGKADAAAGTHNYAEALQKAIYFYETQRSGKLPANNRVEWRGDSGLRDGADVGVDLTGGWYDAGDHVKFGLPMAYSATMLAWSVVEYRDGYENAGQLEEIKENIKWATDYFMKAHTKPNELWGQVGAGNTDHAWWGPAEVMQMNRPSFKIDASCPGSDLAGETAAALAAASIVFADDDPDYSARLLRHAKELYNFADTYRGKYSDCITDAQTFYNSWSGYYDELAWGGAWLYLATNDSAYLSKAIAATDQWASGGSTNWPYTWTQGWDNKNYGAQILLARITSSLNMPEATKFIQSTERNLDYWSVGTNGNRVRYTPGGLAWLDQWGSLRYAANASFIAFVYSDWVSDPVKKARYQDFAVSQMNYILGDNPRQSSYVVGYGQNAPQHPHHRTAHGSWANSEGIPASHRHILYGAMVGGPDASDQYTDDIGDYVSNEVATDYNAGFTGALAKMNLLFGQGHQPLANFPAPEVKGDEFFVEAAIKASGSNYTEIRAMLNNRSAWPARMGDQLSFKYFLDLSEVYAAGRTVSDVNVTASYAEGATISQPVVVDANQHIYAITADFSGTKIYPGGEGHYRKEIQFRISGPQGAWNSSNDHSFQNLGTGNVAKSVYLPVYDAGVRVYGQEPGIAPVTVPSAPANVQAAAGSAQVALNWTAVPGATSYSVKRSETAGGTYTSVATGINGLTHTDTGLANGTTYYYVVTAVNSAGESGNSVQVSATPQAASVVPGALTLTGTAGNAQTILSWTSSTGAASYKVQRAIAGGAYTDVATGVTALTYTDATALNGTTYSYRIVAVNAAGQTLSNVVTLTPSAPPATTGTLEIQYRSTGSGASSNAVTPQFNVKNTGTQAVDLSTVKLRYYFTKDGSADLSFWCDYAQVGAANIEGRFVNVNPAKGTADTYLEIGFKSGAGSLAPGAETGVIQARFSKTNWSNFDQSNDYSYDATKTAFTAWSQVTGYQGNTQVWGIEP